MGCHCGRGPDTISISNATCPAGYFRGIAGLCHKNCSPGYENTGETCFRGVSTLAMGSMNCKPGEERIGARCFPAGGSCFDGEVQQAGLCYKQCKPGFSGVLNNCWQQCPKGMSDCGMGCGETDGKCAMTVVDQVVAPLILAANVATLGLSAAPAAAVKAGVSTVKVGGKLVEASSKVGKLLLKAVNKMQTIHPKNLVEGASVTKRIFAAKTGAFTGISKAAVAKKAGKYVKKIDKAVDEAMNEYAAAFADNFADQTSPEIAAEIDAKFHPKTARFIKETWGRQQLAEMAVANHWAIADNVLNAVSLVDITGVSGVVAAYAKPTCNDEIPFPCVEGSINCK